MPTYSPQLIFDKYLKQQCPVCDSKVDSFSAHKEVANKCTAKYFKCNECKSEYTVGFNKTILSEITRNTAYPK